MATLIENANKIKNNIKPDLKTSINNKLTDSQTKITNEKLSEYSEFIDNIQQGSDPIIQELDVSSNGIYTAPSGVDGYSPVKVNVQPTLQSKTTTENGTITADSGYNGLSQVIVDVPETEPVLETIDITSNGSYEASEDIDGYNIINVDVQPNLQDKTITDNGTYTADDNYDGLGTVTVNVQSGDENEFFNITDAHGLFNYCNSSNRNQYLALWNAIKNNKFTNAEYMFAATDIANKTYGSYNNIIIGNRINFADLDLSNCSSCNYIFYNAWNTNGDFELNFTGLRLYGTCQYAFAYNSHSYHNVILNFDSDTFKNITDPKSMFQSISMNDSSYYTIFNFNDENLFNFENATTLDDLFYSMNYWKISTDGGTTFENSVNIKTSSKAQHCDLYLPVYDNTWIEELNFIGIFTPSDVNHMIYNGFSSNNNTSFRKISGISFEKIGGNITPFYSSTATTYFTGFEDLDIVDQSYIGPLSTASVLNLNKIWTVTQDTIIKTKTAGQCYENFANRLPQKLETDTKTRTITINTTLYDSLSDEQKALITDKGYVLASAT